MHRPAHGKVWFRELQYMLGYSMLPGDFLCMGDTLRKQISSKRKFKLAIYNYETNTLVSCGRYLRTSFLFEKKIAKYFLTAFYLIKTMKRFFHFTTVNLHIIQYVETKQNYIHTQAPRHLAFAVTGV